MTELLEIRQHDEVADACRIVRLPRHTAGRVKARSRQHMAAQIAAGNVGDDPGERWSCLLAGVRRALIDEGAMDDSDTWTQDDLDAVGMVAHWVRNGGVPA